jgi:hypothetical protein
MCKNLIYVFLFVLMTGLVPGNGANAQDLNLVGWWKFDEMSGDIAFDSSGNELHGILGSEPNNPEWVSGYQGGALEFEPGDYVDLGNPDALNFGTNDWTLSAWINLSVQGQGEDFICPVISNGGDWTGGIRYSLTVNEVTEGCVTITTDDDVTKVQVTGAVIVNDGNWHHIAVTREGTTLSLYIDGVLDGTNLDIPAGYDLSGTSQHNAYIGTIIDNRCSCMRKFYRDGLIDDIRIFNIAKKESEIAYVMRDDPLIAWQPNPNNDQTNMPYDAVLSWKPGLFVDKHDVYLGTVFNDVNEASKANPLGVLVAQNQEELTYTPSDLLEFGQTYYWRVDEVNDAEPNSPWKGDLWSFTAINYHVVDDFESYNDLDSNDPNSNRIFLAWVDGFDNPAVNGSVVGYANPPFAEQTIVHGGSQSMPYFYDNDMKYSEAVRSLDSMRDWTLDGVQELSLWFRGYLGFVGSFTEGPVGTYTMTASGTDIWDNSDEFHFASKELTGIGSIIVKVESVGNTNGWAKAGVMIRNTLEPNSKHAMVVVTPAQGVSFQRRTVTGAASADTTETDISAPQWVKIERDISGKFTGSYSSDGISWTQIGSELINMNVNAYVGLAVTAHNTSEVCEAKFSNVSITGTVSEQWTNEDIGIFSNAPQPMYASVGNSIGEPAIVYHEDPNVTAIPTWTEWIIRLQDFADNGIDLTDVDNIAIGIGNKGDTTNLGGSGMMFFDDIRLYLP